MQSNSGLVKWESLDQPTFDRFVEALLVRLHRTDAPEIEVTAIDGRGGDGGIDIDVIRDGCVQHIYQLKYFPEGFSGQWSRGRKPQIKRSFEAAMKHHPREWTLVIPRNPTQGERDFVRSLKRSHRVSIHVMGRAQLDDYMARFPDLRDWAVREPLVEVLRDIGMESRALTGPDDLRQMIQRIQQTVDSRDPNWTTSHSMVNGVYTETITPKHDRAHEMDPIGLVRANIEFPLDSDDGKRLNRLIRYGDGEKVTIRSPFLRDMEFRMPKWASSEMKEPVLEILPGEPLVSSATAELQVLKGDDDAILRSYGGEVASLTRGTDGAYARIELRGGVFLGVQMDLDGQGLPRGRASLTFSHKTTGVSASDAAVGLRAVEDLLTDQRLRLTIDDSPLTDFIGGRLTSTSRGESLTAYLDGPLAHLIRDLAAIEQHLSVTLPIPTEASPVDRILARSLRLLLEGKIVLHPLMDGFKGTMPAVTEPALADMIRSGEGGARIIHVDETVELFGRRLAIGAVQYELPSAEIPNAAELLHALENGNSEGMPIRLQAKPGTGIRVALPGRLPEPADALELTPWALPGIREHDELLGTTRPPSD